nr:immunoglobulin light chain junction region [Macaca mulatta]MPO03975.1 immunoglobulin light chain junction region [Macaca mulatta]MPO04025.1 immunoglobulin light chain junction region [Macaca mulatta]MPO04115.1 immunoglobulin light chain junction region [Macaca mulatta]MPO06246.1 immunoglobulin light chain junction region [Macaca mulatta]
CSAWGSSLSTHSF